jgi:hypothetical protein
MLIRLQRGESSLPFGNPIGKALPRSGISAMGDSQGGDTQFSPLRSKRPIEIK